MDLSARFADGGGQAHLGSREIPAFPAYLALACSSSGKAPVRSAQCFFFSERKVVTAYQLGAGSRVTRVAPCSLIGA